EGGITPNLPCRQPKTVHRVLIRHPLSRALVCTDIEFFDVPPASRFSASARSSPPWCAMMAIRNRRASNRRLHKSLIIGTSASRFPPRAHRVSRDRAAVSRFRDLLNVRLSPCTASDWAWDVAERFVDRQPALLR